ncbi:MAG TPA: XdhC family protein [Eudoraea sp.]|nr:XdhC family protein [Eudoraea sp.]
MTHELKKIIQSYETARDEGIAAVLATVVALRGSSYRRPGVRMLILENGNMVGAVSGGCVEKEIVHQAGSVFNTSIPKIMTYDGRYRLGCEGILYILIEPFRPDNTFLKNFRQTLKARHSYGITSHFMDEEGTDVTYGSVFNFEEVEIPLRPDFKPVAGPKIFRQEMSPCFRLCILGAEHDAVQLCTYAALTGWEVIMVVPPDEQKSLSDFPGAHEFIPVLPEAFRIDGIDQQTAVVLMTHSYVKDLKFLLKLKDAQPVYLGLLGPATRREKLLAEFLELCPEVSDRFFDPMYGPAGLALGAETPQEIAIAVLSEIISVVREQEPMSLKDKKGTIHSR